MHEVYDFVFSWNTQNRVVTYLIWESVKHYRSGNTKFHYAKCFYDVWGAKAGGIFCTHHYSMWSICIKCDPDGDGGGSSVTL